MSAVDPAPTMKMLDDEAKSLESKNGHVANDS